MTDVEDETHQRSALQQREETPLERPTLGIGLDRDVARARLRAALFGRDEPVRLGRYHVLARAGSGGMGVVWSAWDPELGRPVALKLASVGDASARARARDEGRALARLSHPNVVPIYDVVDHAEGVLLVMELVEGETLREFAARRPPVPHLVRAYRQAADGLAAAHRRDLIHRDFKPDNAILGADGRVRVLDFGLAHEAGPEGRTSDVIAGTPRYMAPEQRAGGVLTPAVDQYAFCRALGEAIEARGIASRWLAPIVARGTAERPEDRFRSMSELIAALAMDPTTRWRRRGLVMTSGLATASAVVALLAGGESAAGPTCDGGGSLMAASWGDRRPAIEAHLRTLAGPYVTEAAPWLLTRLDDYADAWRTTHRSVCEANQRGELSANLMDRRTACLARGRAALDELGALAENATSEQVADLIVAVQELPAVAACEDDAALTGSVEPPPQERAGAVGEIDEAIARIDVDRDAGRLGIARREADIAVERATDLGYRPLVARALLARGRVAMFEDGNDRGAADFSAATRAAIAVGDDVLAIESFARWTWAVATTSDPERALDGLELVEALVERVGSRGGFASALLENNVGTVALARGDRAAARASFEAARDAATRVSGNGAIELLEATSNLRLVTDDPLERARMSDELVAVYTRLLGPHHPRTMIALVQGELLRDPGPAGSERLLHRCEQLAAHYPSMGAMVAECGLEAAFLTGADANAEGLGRAVTLVLGAAGAGAEPHQLQVARAYRDLASGAITAALAELDAVRVAVEVTDDAPWWARQPEADALLARATVLATGGAAMRSRAALEAAEKALVALGPGLPSPYVARRRAAIDRLRERHAP